MELYKTFNKYISIIAPVAFIVLTFVSCLNRIPFFDETHAFLISQFSLKEIFHLTRIEGHPILWFLILKPLNNINWYPYPMLLINWLFTCSAIVIFWRFAPFNNIIKFLITFSFPFFQFYGVAARPYGLGILITFIITVLYRQSLKKPVLYAFLLVLCVNVSMLNCLLISGFGVIFIYDIIKSKKLTKKQLIYVSLIFLLGLLALFIQYTGYRMPDWVTSEGKIAFIKCLKYFVLNPFANIKHKLIYHTILQILCFIMLYYTPFVLFKKDKKLLCLSVVSFLAMCIFLVEIYPGTYWHYYLFFVLLICTLWLCWEKVKDIKLLNILFILLILMNMTPYAVSTTGMTQVSESLIYRKMTDTILKNEKYKNAKLFSFDAFTQFAPGILVYLKRNGVNVYDNHGADRMSYQNVGHVTNYKYGAIKVSEFIQYLDKEKENYYIAKSNRVWDYQDFSIKDKNYIVNFDLVEAHPEIYMLIFKITFEKLK